jgi:hypothetical protein
MSPSDMRQQTRLDIYQYMRYIIENKAIYRDIVMRSYYKTQVDSLKVTPESTTPSQWQEHVVYGDMHGNVLYAINLMIRSGVIRPLSPEVYQQLQTVYFQKEDLNRAQVDEFIDLMTANIIFENQFQHIIFLGDCFADRGRNDILMVNLFKIIVESGNYPILLFSNHDFAFFEYIFHEEITSHLFDKMEKKFVSSSPGKRHELLGDKQARSLYEFKRWSQGLQESTKELVKQYILPCLHLYVSIYNAKQNQLSVLSHAPIATESIVAAADAYGIPFNAESPQNYHQTIQQVNQKWHDDFCQADCPRMLSDQELELVYIGQDWDDCAVQPKYPALRASHNRPEKQYPNSHLGDREYISGNTNPFLTALNLLPGEGLPSMSLALWKTTITHYLHGHSGPSIDQASEAKIRLEVNAYAREKREKKGRKLHMEMVEKYPTQSICPNLVNLDASMRGREGSIRRNGEVCEAGTLDDWLIWVIAQGDISTMTPERDRDCQNKRIKQRQNILRAHMLHCCIQYLDIAKRCFSDESAELIEQLKRLQTLNRHSIESREGMPSIAKIKAIIERNTLGNDEASAALEVFSKNDYRQSFSPLARYDAQKDDQQSISALMDVVDKKVQEKLFWPVASDIIAEIITTEVAMINGQADVSERRIIEFLDTTRRFNAIDPMRQVIATELAKKLQICISSVNQMLVGPAPQLTQIIIQEIRGSLRPPAITTLHSSPSYYPLLFSTPHHRRALEDGLKAYGNETNTCATAVTQ